ncbi:MAG: hypothetical protein AAB262_09575, partial [Elusimicrobiota bacterium]
EAVLGASPADALVLRFYDWDGPACTFGYSQSYATALEQCRARGWENIAPVRRATGGGIVFHDGDITFSLVFPWDRLCSPADIYKKIHRGIRAALESSGVVTSLWSAVNPSPGLAQSCFVRAEPMDLVGADGRKILGGALRRKAGKGLYQGSLRPEGLGARVEALQGAVLDGVARGWGRAPATEIMPAWREAGRGLETRYRSVGWNERR